VGVALPSHLGLSRGRNTNMVSDLRSTFMDLRSTAPAYKSNRVGGCAWGRKKGRRLCFDARTALR
jgi:hypothetical protein